MRATFAILITIVPLSASVACRTIREASYLTDTERHADSVAVLRSIAATAIATESETTVVVMRPDTTGRLRIVAKDITKTVTRKAETAKRADTAVFVAKVEQMDVRTEKTRESESNTAQAARVGHIVGVWSCFAFLASALALYLCARWKSRN